MVPRPFPFALGIGTDICSISRVRDLICRSNEPALRRLTRRIFSPDEPAVQTRLERFLAICPQNRSDSVEISDKIPKRGFEQVLPYQVEALRNFAQWIAGRFAAKEATIKAVDRKLSLHDVRIHERISKPFVTYKCDSFPAHRRNAPSELQDDRESFQIARLSISHDGEYATATVIAPVECDELAQPNEISESTNT